MVSENHNNTHILIMHMRKYYNLPITDQFARQKIKCIKETYGDIKNGTEPKATKQVSLPNRSGSIHRMVTGPVLVQLNGFVSEQALYLRLQRLYYIT